MQVKRVSFLFLVIAILGLALGAHRRSAARGSRVSVASACAPAPPSLVAWWPGDGNANDIRGENNGTLNGGATATATGKVAQAFTFNGANEVTIPDAPSLNVQALTLDAWVFPTSVDGANDIIVNKESAGDSTQYEMSIRGPQVPGGSIAEGNLAFFIGGISGLPSEESGWVDGGGQVPLNTWTDVALTFDGSSAKAYINGVLTRGVTGLSGNVNVTAGSFRIGDRSPGNGFPNDQFNGSIDEVELFNRALDITEIQSIFNADSGGKCGPRCVTPPAGLVSWWTGDDESVR